MKTKHPPFLANCTLRAICSCRLFLSSFMGHTTHSLRVVMFPCHRDWSAEPRIVTVRPFTEAAGQSCSSATYTGVDMSWISQCGHDLMFSCCKRIPQPHPPKHLAVVFILLILIVKNCRLPSITCSSVQLNIFLIPVWI